MLEKERVEEAVDAILALLKKKDDTTSLVDLPRKIDVQFTLKQIPKLKHKTFPVFLPVSVHYEGREVCIFVKDMDQKTREYEATVQHHEDIFAQKNINWISKIVPMKALRTDYSLPSSKISLAKAYDLFLADSCVMGLLPGILGKIFYVKKKTVPVQVNLDAKKLKEEIGRVVKNPICTVQGSGSSCSVTVSHDKMAKEEIVRNILAAGKQLAKKLPGGQANIRNLYIKGADTTAIPLYIDIESANAVKLPKVKVDKIASYTGDITTVEGAQVTVRADGYVKITKNKEKKTTETKKSGDSDTESKPVDAAESKPVDDTESKPVDDTESKPVDDTESKPVDDDASSAGELSEHSDDQNDSVEKVNKTKKNSKSAKTQKRKSEGKEDGVQRVETKKRKQQEITADKKRGKSSKKGKKATKV